VAGLIRWSIGSIRFKGTELIGLSAHRIVELGIATVPAPLFVRPDVGDGKPGARRLCSAHSREYQEYARPHLRSAAIKNS
jgi:hypothetical protein